MNGDDINNIYIYGVNYVDPLYIQNFMNGWIPKWWDIAEKDCPTHWR